MSSDALLVLPPDAEKAILDHLAALAEAGGPLAGWAVGTRTPSNETPHAFLQARNTDGDTRAQLLYRNVVQLRAWHSSEGTAKRMLGRAVAELRRGLGARVVSPPVALPDPVDGSKMFYQASVQLPQIGVGP